MPEKPFKILAINPGSSSTKVGYFEDETCIVEQNIMHDPSVLQAFSGQPMWAQLDFRTRSIEDFCTKHEIDTGQLDAVTGRGGLLPPLKSGTYAIDDKMLADLQGAARGQHASNLGAALAHAIAPNVTLKCIVDPVSVDELQPVARISGLEGIERESLSHALNTKAIAKRFAAEQGKPYEKLRLIIGHLGSGISISAHENGRMIDVTNSRDEGAFSTERSGSVPLIPLVDQCFSGKFTKEDIFLRIFKNGGLFSYLHTTDIRDLILHKAINQKAKLVFDAMIYQISKEIGAMAAVLVGSVDAILLTGGMVHSSDIVTALWDRLNWIAPIHLYPGENELQALAAGALRILRKEEHLLNYT